MSLEVGGEGELWIVDWGWCWLTDFVQGFRVWIYAFLFPYPVPISLLFGRKLLQPLLFLCLINPLSSIYFDYGPYDVPILPLFTARALSFQTQLRYYLFWLLTNILQIIDIVFEDCQLWRSASICFCWVGEHCLEPRGVDGFFAWEQDYWGSLMSYVDASMLIQKSRIWSYKELLRRLRRVVETFVLISSHSYLLYN